MLSQTDISGSKPRAERHGRWARYLNVALGVWLIISAFAWPHTDASRTHTWVVGVIVSTTGIAAVWRPNLRWANALAGGWLILSQLLIQPLVSATLWHNMLIAFTILVTVLIPSAPRPRTGPTVTAGA